MSFNEIYERSKTLMETGLEKIKNNILIGTNQSPQSSNQMAQEPMNQLRKGLDEARDFCGNSESAQKAYENTKQAISNLANNPTSANMTDIVKNMMDMQRNVGIKQMQNAIQQTQKGIQQAHNDLNSQESLQAGQNAIQGLQQIQQGLNAGSMTQAQKGLQQVQQATQQMQDANKANSPIANQGIQQMQSGIEQMQSAMGNLSNDDLNETGQLNDEGDAAVSKMQSAGEDLEDEVSKMQNQQGQGQQQQGNQAGNQGQQSGQGQGQSNNAGIGQQTSDIRSTNTKLNSGMDNLGNALGQGQKNGQEQGQQSGQGQGQGQQESGSNGDPNRTSSGAPKNPFEDAQQKGQQSGQGQGQGSTNVSVKGQGGNQGQGSDKGLNNTPGTVGQGENVTGQQGNGIGGGFSRDSYSTGKKSGIADTTKLNKKAEEQSLIGKPQYGENDFASGNANVDQSVSKNVTVSYNGKKLTGTVNMDVLSNHDKLHQQAGGSATEKRIEESKMALQNIKTKLELEKQKNSTLDKDSAGKNSDRYIEFGLETNMSWKKLLRRCLQKERRGSSYSYLQPNRRYSNMGMTVVSRVKDKKVDVVKNVKVCVDTSGSVSPEELNLYLSQIARLTKEFDNVEGELLYWSNAVTDAGPFKNIEDLKKIHVGSTGGTDVRCVFEYLNGETKVDGKYEKHKPKEMAAVIIITDGCFYNNYEDYTKIFGNPSYKVIWMIEGNAMDFKPPFGNVVQITRQGD